jgi:hypothetical protein
MVSNMTRLNRMAGTTILLALAFDVVPLAYAQQPRERCDAVSIEAAGQFRIKQSKIKSALATRNRNGVPPFVELCLPAKLVRTITMYWSSSSSWMRDQPQQLIVELCAKTGWRVL